MAYSRDANGQMTFAQSATAKAASDLMGALSDQSGSLTEAQQKAKDYQSALDAATPASEKAAGALTKVGVVAKTAAQQMDELVGAVDELYGRFLSVEEASDGFQTSLHRIADAAKGANKDLHGNSDATLSARDAMRGAVKQGLDYVDALVRQHAPQKQVAAAARASAAAIDAPGGRLGCRRRRRASTRMCCAGCRRSCPPPSA
jgi:ABC-type transporter Mla subunit MlaD